MKLIYADKIDTDSRLKNHYENLLKREGLGLDLEYDNGSVYQEVDLKGLIGLKKIDSTTVSLKFNDGEIIRINVAKNKTDNVISAIKNGYRTNRVIKCF